MSAGRLPSPRPDLRDLAPYRTAQAPADVRLHANEWTEPNPVGRHLAAAELGRLLLNRYPGGTRELAAVLARQLGVDGSQLLFGNGSNEVLLTTFLAFGGPGRRTLLFQPTYSMHARLARIAGGGVVDHLVGLPYTLTAATVAEAADAADPQIVVFTSPNNPTGNAVDPRVIVGLAAARPETLVLVDEAYAEFAGTSVLPAIASHPNLVVSRTFSKARAAAGLRLGTLVAHPAVIEILRAIGLPYAIGALTAAAALAIAKDEAGLARRVDLCTMERERVLAALATMDGVEAHPSVTNFVLLRVRRVPAAAAHAALLEQGVLVRDVSSWPGCAGCLRVSIGAPKENDRVLAALERVLAMVPSR
ncbi:MAG: pyridoxal phosphate-dependent aminotransferase [Candidatus Limnocylindria bacterium]